MTSLTQPRSIADDYRFACMALMVCRFAYYVRGHEVVSDATYDAWEAILRRFEEMNPALVHPDSPTRTVGADSESVYPWSLVRTFPGQVQIDVAAYDAFFQRFAKIGAVSVAQHWGVAPDPTGPFARPSTEP